MTSISLPVSSSPSRSSSVSSGTSSLYFCLNCWSDIVRPEPAVLFSVRGVSNYAIFSTHSRFSTEREIDMGEVKRREVRGRGQIVSEKHPKKAFSRILPDMMVSWRKSISRTLILVVRSLSTFAGLGVFFRWESLIIFEIE